MSGQPVIDFIEKTKTKPFEGGYKKMPDGSIVPYKGQETPFSALNIKPNETGMFGLKDDPKYSVRTTDDYITENGKTIPVKVLARDIQDQIRQNPSVQGALNKMWADYKKQNNIPTASPAEDEKRKYAYAVGVFQQHDPSSITSLTPQHLPRNITNINMGGGVEKKKQDDFDLVASLARTFNNPSSINTQNLTQTKVKGFDKPLYDLTGVFQNLKVRNAKDFNQIGDQINKDVNLDALYIDPSNNNMVFKFPTKKDAESVMGRNMKYNEGYVMIPTSDKKSMKAAINSIATAYNFKENQRKQLVNMVQGAEPATNNQQTKAAPQPASKPAKGKQSEADKLGI
jgi:hypothetical protein